MTKKFTILIFGLIIFSQIGNQFGVVHATGDIVEQIKNIANENPNVQIVENNNVKTTATAETVKPETTTISRKITVEKPKAEEIVVNNSLSIIGKAPSSTLIQVMLRDEDTHNNWIEHLSSALLNATTTSDKNGTWVFVPQQTLPPGYYSVTAAYDDATLGFVNTEKMFFTVSDGYGKTSNFKMPLEAIIALSLILIISAVLIIIKLLKNRKQLSAEAPIQVVQPQVVAPYVEATPVEVSDAGEVNFENDPAIPDIDDPEIVSQRLQESVETVIMYEEKLKASEVKTKKALKSIDEFRKSLKPHK